MQFVSTLLCAYLVTTTHLQGVFFLFFQQLKHTNVQWQRQAMQMHNPTAHMQKPDNRS